MIGPANASKIISGGVFGISMGTNDFVLNYYMNPILRKKYTVAQFQDLLIRSLSEFIQVIYSVIIVIINGNVGHLFKKVLFNAGYLKSSLEMPL